MSFVQIDTTLSYVYFVKKNWSKICHRSMLVIGALFYVFESFSVLIPAIFRRHWGLFLLICYKNFVIDRISDAHLKLNAIIYMMEPDFNSLRPGDTCMCKWTMSSLVQVKTCHLFDTKQSRWVTDDFLSISTTWNKHQWNFNQNRKKIFFQKMYLQMASAKCQPFYSSLDVLRMSSSVQISSSVTISMYLVDFVPSFAS